MSYFTEERSVEAVNERMGSDIDPRLAQVMVSLVGHLHAFAKDVKLTQREWEIGIAFLTRTGQICSGERQEFILLSDTLGLSMLVDAINHRRPPGATENTVLGPFHVPDAPVRQMGDTISFDGKGESCVYEGRVIDSEGRPIEGARIDVWSDNADGFYDVQQPGIQPRWNNRGLFITGARRCLPLHWNKARILPDPGRRPRRSDAGQTRTPSLQARPHALHRDGGRVREPRYTCVRRRGSLPQLRHCLRSKGDTDSAVRACGGGGDALALRF